MKKVFKSFVIVAVLVVAMVSTSAVFAQTTSPGGSRPGNSTSDANSGGMGNGHRGSNQGSQDGPIHDALISAFAEALGLTIDEINALLADGETMSEIAISTGMTYDEFVVLLNEIHEQIIGQAEADGIQIQEQARLYFAQQSRVGGMFGLHFERGTGMRGQGLFGTNDCPYYN